MVSWAAVIPAPVCAQSQPVLQSVPQAVPQPVGLVPGLSSMAGPLEILEDPSHRLQVAELGEAGGRWQPAPSADLNLGHSRSAWWLRLRLAALGSTPQTRVLELQNPRLDDVQVYVVRGGQIVAQHQTGDRLPFASRPVAYHAFAFPLALAAGEEVEVLVRLDSHDGYFGLSPIRLTSEQAFAQGVQLHTMLCGLYYGGLVLLLLYHLCLLGSTRDASFAWYVSYLGSLLATRVAFEGHASQFLSWLPPSWINQGLLVSYSLSVVLFGVMLMANLKGLLAERAGLRRLCWAVIGLNAAPIPMALAGSYSGTLVLAMPATMFSLLFGMGVSVWAWRRGLRHTRFFLAGGACMLVGLLGERLRLESVLPDHPLLAYGVAIGSVLEALCIAIALAESLNRMKGEKLAAEQQAREAQAQLNDHLGHLVQERTVELEAANQRLTQLAITDELTGAFNRRHFQSELDYRVAHARRTGEAVGLCLFDLDHFKGYNDHYGHPAGDEVLRRVSAVVQEHLKRGTDRLFRVGGEEFALLLAGGDLPGQQVFLDEVRGAIEGLGIAHARNGTGVVTASFGLAWCDDAAAGSEALYRAADEWLYRAKATGRNRVVGGPILGLLGREPVSEPTSEQMALASIASGGPAPERAPACG